MSAFILTLSIPAWSSTMFMKAGYWVRLQPNSNGEGVRINERDQQVTVVQTANGWVLVKFDDGKRYWVASAALTEYVGGAAPSQNLDEPDIAQTYHADQDGWPVRSKAGTKTAGSEIVDRVDSATTLSLLGTEKDSDGDTWYRVSYFEDGVARTGYIYEGRVSADDDSRTEACASCNDANPALPANGGDILAAAQGDAKGYQLSSAFNANCSKFINPNGLGPFGQLMIGAARQIAPDCLYRNEKIFRDLCPNYANLSNSKKNAFLGIMFAAMAQKESSCDDGAQNRRGTNGIADGLFQLEYAAALRIDAGRNPKYCPHTSVNSQSLEFQAECTVSIIKDRVCAFEGRRINYSGGYWAQLRGDGEITRLIRSEVTRQGLCN